MRNIRHILKLCTMEFDQSARYTSIYTTLIKAGSQRAFATKPVPKPQTVVITKPDPSDPLAENYGDRGLIQSQVHNDRQYRPLSDLNAGLIGQEVWLRARVHGNRMKGNGGFLVLRQQIYSAQVTLFKGDFASTQMLKYAVGIPRESIVDIFGLVKEPAVPIQSSSQNEVEVEVRKIYVVNRSATQLPLQIEDISRPMTLEEALNEGQEDNKKEETKDKGKKVQRVSQKVRLDNRVLDLRSPINQALCKISSGVCMAFRNYLLSQQFIEIHTPKLLGGTSEGGANVFRLKYFGRDACLAQSPQLYKQMAIMGDLDRVFEIGPVFRAENTNTHRHLCEFTGLDMEMTIYEHYYEALNVIHGLFINIFETLNTQFASELAAVQHHFPFIQPFQYTQEPVWLSFPEGIKMLHDAGIEQDEFDDLSTETEKALGALVKEKYNTDFYILHSYPTEARPFYTMLKSDDPRYTCSYDVFMRGEEIISGAQRIHDPEFLARQAKIKGIPVHTIQDYIDSFKYGAYPHAGCGVGLERVVMLFCGLKNIRWTSLFPRDPKRIAP